MQKEAMTQSKWIVMKAADMHYIQGISQQEIAVQLQLSEATVSRIIGRAKKENVIKVALAEPYENCMELGRELERRYALTCAVVIPTEQDEDELRAAAALEGARYLQRIIKAEDVLGVAWGRTMYQLIHSLNPCRKSGNSFVSLHGSIGELDERYDVDALLSRVAMAMWGTRRCFEAEGISGRREDITPILKTGNSREIFRLQKEITISISGIGMFAPEMSSPLLRHPNITPEDISELEEQGACGDILLRFIDSEGRECDTDLKKRTLAMSLEDYRQIPCKILVAVGRRKSLAVRAALRGGLADVVVLDAELAQALLESEERE